MQSLNQLIDVMVSLMIIGGLILAGLRLFPLLSKGLSTPNVNDTLKSLDKTLDIEPDKKDYEDYLSSIYREVNTLIIHSSGILKKHRDYLADSKLCQQLLSQIVLDPETSKYIIKDRSKYYELTGQVTLESCSLELTDENMLNEQRGLTALMQTIATRKGQYKRLSNEFYEMAMNECKPLIDKAYDRLTAIEVAGERSTVAASLSSIHSQLNSMEKELKLPIRKTLADYLKIK